MGEDKQMNKLLHKDWYVICRKEEIEENKILLKYVFDQEIFDKLSSQLEHVEMIKRKYTNAINFEHTLFLDEHIIEYLLNLMIKPCMVLKVIL